MSNNEALLNVLEPYLELYPHNKLSSDGLALYVKALSDIPPAAVHLAMLKIVKTSDFFPTVAEIRKQAQALKDYFTGTTLPTSGEAWEEVTRLVKTCHLYRPWEFSCPEVEQAVKRFGRYELCNLEMSAVNTARAQFCRFYEEVVNQKQEKSDNEAVLAMLPKSQKLALENKIEQIGSAL